MSQMSCPNCGSHEVALMGRERLHAYEAYARCSECGWRSHEVYARDCPEAFHRLERLLTPPDKTAVSRPATIIDKLRAMSDEELAEALATYNGDSLCDLCEDRHGDCDAIDTLEKSCMTRCKERILAYLQTPLTNQEQEDKEMSAKLKPCPFCGGTDMHYFPDVPRPRIQCKRCGAEVKSDTLDGGKPAFEKWNIRQDGLYLNDYQRLAQRTSGDEPGYFATVAYKKIDNGVLGMAGEGGECADIWKKHLHQGHTLDADKLADECGDVLWYVAELAAGLGLTLEEIAARNIAKLEKRYPEGHFEAERSINREE